MAASATASELIRSARSAAGLTQHELADRLSMAQSVISAYEAGRRQPSLSTLSAIVAAAGHELSVDVRPDAAADRLYGRLGRRIRRNRTRLVRAAFRHGATNLRVFGSVARGDETPDSDVDFLVDLPEQAGLLTLFRLERDFEELLGTSVDVVPADAVRPRLRRDVLRDAVPL